VKLRASEWIGLAAITFVAALARFWAISFGLPHLFARPDEDAIVAVALGIYRRGPDPQWFLYPTLYIYLVAFGYEVYYAVLAARGHALSAADFAGQLAANPWPFFLTPRVLTAAMGTLSVPVLFLAARRLFDARTAWIAAALLAAAFLHVRDSHFGVADIPATFATLVAFWAIVSAELDPRRAWRVMGVGALCGVAASMKYNVVLIALPLFVRLARRARETQAPPRAVAAACAAAAVGIAAGFFAGTPFAIVEPRRFYHALAMISTHLAGGHGPDLGRGWSAHLRISLLYGLGLPMLAASLAGAAWLARARPADAAVVLAFPLTYYLAIGAGRTVFVRYIDPVVPFACLTAAFALGSLARAPGGRSSRVVIAALLTFAVAWPSIGRVVAFDRLIACEDNRNVAAAWMEATFPPGTMVAQAGGSTYGELEFRKAAQFLTHVYNPATEGFQLNGRNVATLPDVIVRQRCPLVAYCSLPDPVSILLQTHYRSMRVFDVGTAARGSPPVYDQNDAFFVPLDGFEHLSRPGPAFDVFARVTP